MYAIRSATTSRKTRTPRTNTLVGYRVLSSGGGGWVENFGGVLTSECYRVVPLVAFDSVALSVLRPSLKRVSPSGERILVCMS